MNNPAGKVVYEFRRDEIHNLYDMFLFDNNILIKDIKYVEYVLSQLFDLIIC